MKTVMSILLVAGTISLLTTPVTAQEELDEVSSQIWADYHAHYYLNDRIEWYADTGLRTLTGNIDWSQAYARPSLRFHRYKAMDIHAGLGVFFTNNQGADDVLEIRPWQGVKFFWPKFKNISFANYFRLEQRLTFSSDNYEFGLRGRYKLSTRIPIKKALHNEVFDPLFVPLSAELFSDFGQRVDPLFGSRLRLDAGLGYVVNDDWVFEFHFIAQLSRSGKTETLETTEYILRFQIKHLFSSKDYRKQRDDLPD